MDWGALVQRSAVTAGPDAQDVKGRLPIPYVLDRWSIPLEQDGSRYVAVCPFHDDSDPSLDVFGESLERWGCFACGAKGDVFDLVQRLAGTTTFPETLRLAATLLTDVERDGWAGPRIGIPKVYDSGRAHIIVSSSMLAGADAVDAFLKVKHEKQQLLGVTTKYLQQSWGVGSWGNEVIVPYWTSERTLVAYKRRTAETALHAARGADFSSVLYGDWHPSGGEPLLLTEGESDAWAADRALDGFMQVRGLPTGAGSHPVQAEWLASQSPRVVVALDGDQAGRSASAVWAETLTGLGVVVTQLLLPDGYDLAKIGSDWINSAVRQALG